MNNMLMCEIFLQGKCNTRGIYKSVGKGLYFIMSGSLLQWKERCPSLPHIEVQTGPESISLM